MRFVRLGIIGVLVVGAAIAGHAAPPLGATLVGMGATPTNINATSIVRDATKVGSTISAVGSSGIEATLWTIDGTSSVPTVLLYGGTFTAGAVTVVAGAITPDGAFIASQARSPGGPVALRVQTTGLGTIDLNQAPFQTFPVQTSARAISDNGSVLYGFVSGPTRAVRFDFAGATSTVIPLLPNTNTGNQPAFGATSSDGSVMAGVSFNSSYVSTTNGHAFRYVHGSPSGTVSAIPELPGGTWSKGMDVSPNGQLILVDGDSTHYPNGEAYLYNTASSGTTTRLGSPNLAWSPVNAGGMTSDGSIVVQSFAFNVSTARYPYFHNSHGWFQLASALADAGIDLTATGWTMEGGTVTGVSPDGTMVFGQALHESAAPLFRRLEGFVAELPPGYLANYDPVPVAPSNASIVGTWHFDDAEVWFLLPNGVYYMVNPSAPDPASAPGFERGLYSWDPATSVFTFKTLEDTDGDSGISGANGQSALRVDVVGDNLTLSVPSCTDPGCPPPTTGSRVVASPGSIVGGWVAGDSSQRESSLALLLMPDGTYYFADDTEPNAGGHAGIEKGTYLWNSVTGALSTATAVNTDGTHGLSNPPPGARTLILSSDELAFTYTDTEGSVTATRIIDYASVTPVITSALSASGTVTVPFSLTVTATHGAFTFGATGLPAGLSISESTGVILGTPSVAGTFDVGLSAANTLSTAIATLHIVIDVPNTPTGNNVSIVPDVPPGAPGVGVTFSSVTQPGETTVAVIDLNTVPAGQAPPSGFSLGDPPIYLDIATTSTFSGPVSICFNYTGVDFGSGTPRLFHFVGGVWVDITTSVDAINHIICGAATSFSPFAIFVSPITRTGFYAPVSPVATDVNTVKGGSTVPLKFNVFVHGVEKKDTAGLLFSVVSVNCAGGATEDPVDFTTTGDTSLRYDGTQFIQNWKTPKTLGCYIVRMTTTADGLSLSAIFKMK